MPDGTERLTTTTTVLTAAVRHQTAHAPAPEHGGPATWLMYSDGRAAVWPGRTADVWDLNVCTCPCHDRPPALGHPYRPHVEPEPTGPETWPERRPDPAPPGPPTPIVALDQLDLLTHIGGAS
ncbi:hypothetical protein ACFRCG_39685 [Embleya sp. NPDC056575]|uniref:hypothetical protein n=1 Tax=unclassified Embleya TaxID=2699296 RepID=UPI0036A1D85E